MNALNPMVNIDAVESNDAITLVKIPINILAPNIDLNLLNHFS
jgi:hypothetical protein